MSEAASWDEISRLIERLGDESHVARRVRIEREERGWSQVDLAERMTSLGSPMNKSSIWRIENPGSKAGRRGITIGEAIGFSRAFGTTLAELLLPDSAILDVERWRLVLNAAEALEDVRAAWHQYSKAMMTARVNLTPEIAKRAEEVLGRERATFIESFREHWEPYKIRMIESGLPAPDDSEFETWALGQQPKPLVAALEDVLDEQMPDDAGWATGRRVR
ncbi:helix-turn-helix domain-containing protein [Agromyces humatus]|uniref:HTH cro/C1-type domain-containing protein n=1 Tax=Agromyces humatus TaxID=279573 RepID=A0ABP4X207_9MICO|nr:helix-turn-helix transcriptional regulator [Agromyces humatus]